MSPLSLIPQAHAAVINSLQNGPGVSSMWEKICSVLPFCDVGPNAPQLLFAKVLDFVFSVISGAAIIMIIYGGIQLIAGQGSEETWEQGKKIVTYAVAGLLLSLVGQAIVNYVANQLIPSVVG